MKLRLVFALAVVVAGCSGQANEPWPVVVGGKHPYVRGLYYELHPDAFKCKDDPYACAACPVGNSDRVIEIRNRDKSYDVPTQVNAWFACGDINMLVPEKGYADSDVFICERTPPDGSIKIDGHTIKCAGEPQGQKTELGTIQPGESKTITVPIQ